MKFRKLVNTRSVPPGGFVFRDPDTQYVSRGTTLAQCVDVAIRHRKANGLAVADDFPYAVEDAICRRLPPRYSEERNLSTARRVLNRLRLNVATVKRGTQGILAVAVGKNLVPDAVAKRRAAICSTCPFNVHSEGCSSCKGIPQMVRARLGHQRVKQLAPFALKTCYACTCQLEAKVWLSHQKVMELTSLEDFGSLPDMCWIKQEETNALGHG